jgi:hypothetical protein
MKKADGRFPAFDVSPVLVGTVKTKAGLRRRYLKRGRRPNRATKRVKQIQKARIKVLRMLSIGIGFPRMAYCGRLSVMDRFSWKGNILEGYI